MAKQKTFNLDDCEQFYKELEAAWGTPKVQADKIKKLKPLNVAIFCSHLEDIGVGSVVYFRNIFGD